jgi:hypothetical protein
VVDLPRMGPGLGTTRRPERLAKLPHIAGSFPGDSTGDSVRSWALGLRRCCSICGCRINGPVYKHVPFETWRGVLPLCEAAVDADAKRIDTSSRWYWGLNALDHLEQCKRHDETRVAKMRQTA